MPSRALHFGAGNIGRGFIGLILSEAGMDVIFTDVMAPLINALNERRKYPVHIVSEAGQSTREVTIAGAVMSNEPAVFEEIVNADILTTAVGPRILERIAPTIAKGLAMRRERGVEKPLNVIACENAIKASSSLKTHVLRDMDKDMVEWTDKHVGFVDCAVDRIVPPARHEDILAVTVEEFFEWVVDETQFVGDVQKIDTVKYTDNLVAFIERKLLTVNTGHAVCAYYGKKLGHAYIKDAINDPRVRTVVEGAMKESGSYLVKT